MRIGQNPAKTIQQVAKPQSVTVILVNYIPIMTGYFTQSLDVLKLCLDSLRKNSGLPFDLMLFDNASCPEVRQFLIQAHTDGQIQYLILSEQNMGKSGAWNICFAAAPGEIVAYSDNDIYYHPGWLAALTKAFDDIPELGMLTGMPLLNPQEYSTSTLAWVENHPDVGLEKGQVLPWEDYWRHAGSLGNEESRVRAFYEENQSLRLTVREEQYYAGAGHFQFVARKDMLQRVLPLPNQRPMGQVRALDVAINELGGLRLCTAKWWVHHMGNTLDGEDQDVSKLSPLPPQRRSLRRKLLTWLSERSFEALNR